MVNDQVIVGSLGDIPKDMMLIGPLAQKLAEYADQERQLEIDVGKEFTHQINIQGDEKMSFEILFKVMFTCSKSDFYKMRLITVSKAG
jgi:biopolymer transport protein ExbD